MTDSQHFFLIYFNFLNGEFQSRIAIKKTLFKKYIAIDSHFYDEAIELSEKSSLGQMVNSAFTLIHPIGEYNLDLINSSDNYFFSKQIDIILKFWYGVSFEELFFYSSEYESWLSEAMKISEIKKINALPVLVKWRDNPSSRMQIQAEVILIRENLSNLSLFILNKIEQKMGKPNINSNVEELYQSLLLVYKNYNKRNSIALDFAYQFFLYFKKHKKAFIKEIHDEILIKGYLKHKQVLEQDS